MEWCTAVARVDPTVAGSPPTCKVVVKTQEMSHQWKGCMAEVLTSVENRRTFAGAPNNCPAPRQWQWQRWATEVAAEILPAV